MQTNKIDQIIEKVLEEWFGTKDLKWVETCPKDELSKEDVIGCIKLAVKLTAKEILEDLRENVNPDLKLTIEDDELWEQIKKVERKWGV